MSSEHSRICPEDAVLVSAFLGDLTIKQYDELMAHVLACPRCRLKFQSLRQVKKELRGAPELHRKEGPPRRAARMEFAGAAAVIGFLVLVGFFTLSRYNKGLILRGGAQDTLSLIAPADKISAAPSIFRWTPLINADIYVLVIIDDELNRVFTSSTAKTSFRLPEDIKMKLVRKRTYVWIIEAYDDDSSKLDSAKKAFEIQ